MTVINLIPNPSAEGAVSGWTPDGAVVADAARSRTGSRSLRVDNDGTRAIWNNVVTDAAASTAYTYSQWMWVPSSVTGEFRVRVGGPGVATAALSEVVTARDEWIRVAVPFTTGASGGVVAIFPAFTPGSGSWVGSVWVDNLMMTEGETVHPYFDGATADTPTAIYAWTGEPHASASTWETVEAPAGSSTSGRTYWPERGYYTGQRVGRWPVTLGGLALGYVDDEGVDWIIESFEGWASKPEARVETADRAHADGSLRGPGFYGAKTMSLTLKPSAADPDTRARAEARLRACVSSRAPSLLVVHEETPTQMWVYQEAALDIDRAEGSGLRFAAQVNLIAHDPHKYGTVLHRAETGLPRLSTGGVEWPLTWPATWTGEERSGVLTVTNDGNDSTYPALRVYGPLPWFVLDVGGRRLTVSNPDGDTLGPGQWVDIDTAGHHLDFMGRNVNAWASGQWPVFGPGMTEVRFSSWHVNTDALLVAEWRDSSI